jgi:pyruvate/2-oxoglutarate/acetoin dehydrogenase E1 component/TPP-dependent pyruvate/acetoin dehydrogenase alpha subunit
MNRKDAKNAKNRKRQVQAIQLLSPTRSLEPDTILKANESKSNAKSTGSRFPDLPDMIPAKTRQPDLHKDAAINDYRIAYRSRLTSILARQEVFSGKAKFGIFGDGKEVAQVALAHAFQKGDFRSGYYRDQTLMFALGLLTLEEYFAQLYGHADLAAEPYFGGRSMTGHFATRLLNPDGSWKNQTQFFNSAADLSPTSAQMPRLVGLALASKLYRLLPELAASAGAFTNRGEEIAFGTIGNASCAEGLFWESINAIAVLQAPALIAIWDDGYGISVPNELQVAKSDISNILEGFQRRDDGKPGIEIFKARGWDYFQLRSTFLKAEALVRFHHIPAIVHVIELTQPQGHSTSGSQERYKSAERMKWEREFDCLRKMREFLLSETIALSEELNEIESQERAVVLDARDRAWHAYQSPIEEERRTLVDLLSRAAARAPAPFRLDPIRDSLQQLKYPIRRDLMELATEALLALRDADSTVTQELAAWKLGQDLVNEDRYGSNLYSASAESALKVPEIKPVFSEGSPEKRGFEILNACFDAAFARYPNLVAMGEDIGKLGDVNQGFAGLQSKYGERRIMDTGIREATIVGQAIGLALRGFKTIADIQYLDYLLFALEPLADDLATLRWRTCGGQKAPVIIRTRGHRLEGIWHSGSPMAGILNLIRGIYVCVPRDATQAAGFYNTLLESDDPALVIEVLNAYRRKAPLPDNVSEFRIPLGIPEIIRSGSDVTLVTYGACCAIALEAARLLQSVGIEVELIDVRTLLPFDREGVILKSLQKTSRILFLDEDCPGGATAYMMQKVLEERGGYQWLDSPPRTLTAKEHRPAYGSDGDYFSKPNRTQIFESVYAMLYEAKPNCFPKLW